VRPTRAPATWHEPGHRQRPGVASCTVPSASRSFPRPAAAIKPLARCVTDDRRPARPMPPWSAGWNLDVRRGIGPRMSQQVAGAGVSPSRRPQAIAGLRFAVIQTTSRVVREPPVSPPGDFPLTLLANWRLRSIAGCQVRRIARPAGPAVPAPLRRRQLDPALGDQKIYAEHTRHPRSGRLMFLGLISEIVNDADEPSDRPDA